jgi:hypothetical protein
MVCGTSGEPQYIKAYHGCYDPLSYPLFFPRGEAIPLKVCVFLCDCDSVYHSFFSQLVPKHYLMFQLMEMSMLARTKLRRKGMKVNFQ